MHVIYASAQTENNTELIKGVQERFG